MGWTPCRRFASSVTTTSLRSFAAKKEKSRKPRLSASASEKDTAWEKSSQGTSAAGDDDADGGADAEDVAQSIMQGGGGDCRARLRERRRGYPRAPRAARAARRG